MEAGFGLSFGFQKTGFSQKCWFQAGFGFQAFKVVGFGLGFGFLKVKFCF